MDYNVDIFSSLAADDSDRRVAHRKSLAVANKRVSDRFGAFLAAAKTREDYSARLDLIRADVHEAVASVCNEHGGDPDRIERSIYSHLAEKTANYMDHPDGLRWSDEDEHAHQIGAIDESGTCQHCGGKFREGYCQDCGQDAEGIAEAISRGEGLGDDGLPQGGGNPVETGRYPDWTSDSLNSYSSTKEARRPKMCPYHREVTDISLASGDPTAGFNAMSQHAWGEQHCQGAFEGGCNFKPAMVTQKYWDDKAEQAQERREQRELERAQQQEIFEPEAQDIVPDTIEGIDDTPAPEEGSLDAELAEAPSAVGEGIDSSPEPVSDMGSLEPMAASKQAEALKTVDVTEGSETGFPEIDKGKWDPMNRGQSGKPIDTEESGSPHPTETVDPIEPIKADRTDDFLDQTDAVTESQDVEKTAPVQTDKANSGSWKGNNGASPVTSAQQGNPFKVAASDVALLGGQGQEYPVLHAEPHSNIHNLTELHPEKGLTLDGVPFEQIPVNPPQYGGREGGPHQIQVDHPDPRMVQAVKHILENTHTSPIDEVRNIISVPDPRLQQPTSSVEPRSNPIIDMLKSGYVPQAQVDKAIDEWKRNEQG